METPTKPFYGLHLLSNSCSVDLNLFLAHILLLKNLSYFVHRIVIFDVFLPQKNYFEKHFPKFKCGLVSKLYSAHCLLYFLLSPGLVCILEFSLGHP